MSSVTTGWNNEQAKDAVRRTMLGGPSGRVAVLLIAAVILAIGIYGRAIVLSALAGVVTIVAAVVLVRSAYHDRAVRRMERRSLAGPGDQQVPSRRRFVSRDRFGAMSGNAPDVDLDAFRADQAAAIEQEPGEPV
jgi:hypothetical protein